MVHNGLPDPILLSRAPVGAEDDYLAVILNGRRVEAEQYCNMMVMQKGDTVHCTIDFDPDALKSGEFRIFHNMKHLQTYGGEAIQDSFQFRLLYDGTKYRQTRKFDCVDNS